MARRTAAPYTEAMRFFYSDTFNIPLPDGHRFPGAKYRMLRETLLQDRVLKPEMLRESPLAERHRLLHAHHADFVTAVETGGLDDRAQRRIGLPWSAFLVRRTKATMGGAIKAVEAALEYGISGQLAGGTHHAHRDFGAGFCVFNDFAVAALTALAEGWAARIAIIDLDVHQGDGNAAILRDHPDVFVFSMHGGKNFPFDKVAGDLDVDLADGTEDTDYLRTLADHLPAVFAFNPDLVLYQAGVDPLKGDRLGRMALSHAGLMARDRLVLSECASRALPVSMAIGGGYADPIARSVAAYANTYRVAAEIHRF